MNPVAQALFLAMTILPLDACAETVDRKPGVEEPVQDRNLLEFRAEVIYNSFESGFWGLVSEDGRRFDPGGLPPEFQQSGLKVQVTARPLHDRVTFRMWGTAVEIVRIERVAPR